MMCVSCLDRECTTGGWHLEAVQLQLAPGAVYDSLSVR